MTLARYYIDKIKIADSELEQVGMDAIKENMEFIMLLIKEKQFDENIRSDGSLMPKYSKSTQNYWRYVDPPRNREMFDYKVTENRYNLDWSGNFKNSMYIKIMNDGFDILSRDRKMSIINTIAKGDVMKLTEEHNKIVNNEVVIPALLKRIESIF